MVSKKHGIEPSRTRVAGRKGRSVTYQFDFATVFESFDVLLAGVLAHHRAVGS